MLVRIIMTIVMLAVFGTPVYLVFHEDFSDQESITESFDLVQQKTPASCQLRTEVTGKVWLACKASTQPDLDEWPDGLPSNFPPYQGVVAVPGFILDTIAVNKRMKPEDIILRVKNPYKEYCLISSWITQKIRPIKPLCPNDTIAR